MDDFILKVRLEALKHTLIQVQKIFVSVRARRNDILELKLNIETAGQNLNTVIRSLTSLISFAKPAYGAGRVDPEVMHLLDLMESEGHKLGDSLEKASANIRTIRNRWSPIEKVEELVRESLHDSIDTWIDQIDKSLNTLKGVAEERNNGGTVNNAIEAAWKEYAGIMSEQTRLFSFSDYVEFLGGVALRDAGLDEGICRIADELIQSCSSIGKTNWNALTIPAHHESVTLARSIRMGFPEWTLWAVPLTAHELGHVLITGGRNRLELDAASTQWEKYIFKQVGVKNNKKDQRERQHRLIYLADAFATYAMGPAYACSAILLRFNSLAAYTDGEKYPADAKRAYVILNMLRRMLDSDKQDTPPYEKTVNRLEAGWNAALARARASDSLSQAEKNKLEDINSYMLSQLSKGKGLYRGRRLKKTREALDGLFVEQDPLDILKGDEEGRDVLNAAWECRIENTYDLASLQANAQKLWDLIIEQKKSSEQTEMKPGVFALASHRYTFNNKRGEDMAETIGGTQLDRAASVKDELRNYWLPSARALGKQAVPLYYAELNRAVNAYNLVHLDEAELILDALLKELEQTLPDHVDRTEAASFHLLYAGVLTGKGRVWECRKQEKQARSLFKKAVEQFSEWIQREQDAPAQAYCDFGVALFKSGSTKRTIQALEQAREKITLNAEALRYLAICYCQTMDFSKASECFTDSLKLEPGDSLTHKALAECLEKQGKISEAMAEYSQVALFLTTSGMFAEAQRITDHMLELDPKDPIALVRAGETLLASGLPEKALETLDKGLELQTKNAGAIRLKGHALFVLKRYEEAAKQFQRALKLDPTLYKARIKLAASFYYLGNFSAALAVLDEALNQRPDDPEALIEKGNLLNAMQDNVGALAVLDKALKISPNDPRALGIKGQVLTELREYKKAIQVLDKATKSDPTDPRAYAALGQALSMLDQHDRALEALDKALAIQPNYGPALVYKGETLRAKGDNEEALQALNQALALGTDAWALGTKGQVLGSLGMYEEAVKVLRESVELDPSLAWAHGELIVTLYRLERFEETLEALEQALELHPSSEWFVFEGHILNEIAEFELAIKALDRALEINQDSSQAYGAKGWALENLRDGQGALDSYSRAESIEKKNLYWQIGVANSFYLKEETEKASEKYRRVLKQAKALVDTEPHLEAVGLMGWCEYRLGNFKEAIELCTKVVSATPDMVNNVFNLALALMSKGRNEDGLREYRRALRLTEGKSPLARRGLIFVAHDDLDLAIKMDQNLAKVPEVNEAKSLLSDAFAKLPKYKSASV